MAAGLYDWCDGEGEFWVEIVRACIILAIG